MECLDLKAIRMSRMENPDSPEATYYSSLDNLVAPTLWPPSLPSLDAEIPPCFAVHDAPHDQPGPRTSVENNSEAEKVGTTYLAKCIS